MGTVPKALYGTKATFDDLSCRLTDGITTNSAKMDYWCARTKNGTYCAKNKDSHIENE
jgi:hypothetical protein